MCGDDWVIRIFIIADCASTTAVATVADGDDRGDYGTAECSVIGQPMGCYWLLKLVPFCSGLHPYPIVIVAAADDDPRSLPPATVVTATVEVQTAMLTYHSTSGSAIAEGPHDVLVSRNSTTTKYRYRVYRICVILRLAVFTRYRSVTDTPTQTDGQIHDDGMYCA